MNRKPNVDEHVTFFGNAAIGECTGRVEHVYPTYDPKNLLKPIDFDPELTPVRVRVDAVPNRWPYTGYVVFAPRASEIWPTADVEAGRVKRPDTGDAA